MIDPDELRIVPEFSGLKAEELAWVADHAESLDLQTGEKPLEPGARADHMMLILSGSLELSVPRGEQWESFGTFEAGSITGLLPYSRMVTFGGRATAMAPTRLALIPREHLAEMIYRIPDLGQPLIARMSDRVRTSERGESQREKMMALGKMSAGLAHELNNPAAAVRRSAATLRERLDALVEQGGRLARHGLQPEQIAIADSACRLGAEAADALSSLERSEREEELIDWLSDLGVEDAWDLAPIFVEVGLDQARLSTLVESLPADAVPDVLAWLAGSQAANRLLADIAQAADRISELVSSVKAYTHMDRAADKELTRIEPGIANTLTMLGHKVRRKGITVDRSFDPELPAVPAHPGELNQVWTNLIDNAVDAMPDGGTLRLYARCDDESVTVLVEDNGSGIPPDVKARIFEPFYTTKGVGEGTGLGLDIVHRIVTTQHGGSIRVDSEPGRTVFSVQLPR